MPLQKKSTPVRKLTFRRRGKNFTVKHLTYRDREIYTAERQYIPNPAEYPARVYINISDPGSQLVVDDLGAMLSTTSTSTDQIHLAYLAIDCTGFESLEYTAYTSGTDSDGNYRTALGIMSAIPTRDNIGGRSSSTFDIKNIADGWVSGREVSGSVSIAGRGTVYVCFGQGKTIAAGNQGHGTSGFRRLILK